MEKLSTSLKMWLTDILESFSSFYYFIVSTHCHCLIAVTCLPLIQWTIQFLNNQLEKKNICIWYQTRNPFLKESLYQQKLKLFFFENRCYCVQQFDGDGEKPHDGFEASSPCNTQFLTKQVYRYLLQQNFNFTVG